MTPAQCKAARAVLRWTVEELSRRSGVPFHALAQWERGDHLNPEPRERIRQCLEAAGLTCPRDGCGVSWHAISDEVDRLHSTERAPSYVRMYERTDV